MLVMAGRLLLGPSVRGGEGVEMRSEQSPREHGNFVLCGAKNRQGNPCRRAPMPNGRCNLHGGKSTGARTAAGIECIKLANTIHGKYTKEAKASAREVRQLIR